MAGIDRLKGIKQKETDRLQQLGIYTIDALWSRVGRSQDNGMEQLTQASGISLSRLVDLLTAQALTEIADRQHRRRWQFAWAIIAIISLIGLGLFMMRFPSLITPLGCLTLLILLVAGLSLRTAAMLDWLPLPFGLPPAIPVAARDLPVKHCIDPAADLVSARIPASDDTFHVLGDLQNLTLRQSVRRGQPLRFSDVQRPQVTAKRLIAKGQKITDDVIDVSQSIFDSRAVLTLDQARGRVALHPFTIGDVLLLDWLSGSPESQQVVISATPLEPLQLISATALTLGPAPADSEGFKHINQVVGHVSLRPISEGKVIRQADISPTVILPADLANRQILSLPVVRGAYSTGAMPGTRVTIIISPQEVGSQTAVTLSDALILAVEPLSDGGAAFTFAVVAEVSNLAPVLGSGKVFIVQKPQGLP